MKKELERPCPRAKEKAFRGRTAKPGGRPEAQRLARRRALPFQRMRRRARNANPACGRNGAAGRRKHRPKKTAALKKELERPCPRAKEKVFRGRTAKPGGRPEAQRPTRRRALPFQRMRRRESGRLRGARRVRQCVFGRRVRAACGTAGPNRRTPYFARHAAARWHRGAFCTSAAARAHALAARMMWTRTRPFCPRARCAGALCSGTERPKRRFIRRTGVTLCWAAGAVWLHVGPGRCAENEKEAGVC